MSDDVKDTDANDNEVQPQINTDKDHRNAYRLSESDEKDSTREGLGERV